MVRNLLLVDKWQGLAQILVEYVQSFILLNHGMKKAAISAPDSITIVISPEVKLCLAIIGNNFGHILDLLHPCHCLPYPTY